MEQAGVAALVNPTTCLPSLRSQPKASELFLGICHLAELYSPRSLTDADRALKSQLAVQRVEAVGVQDALDAARVDETEKRFATSWITRVIGGGLYWIEAEDTEGLSADSLLDLAGRVLGGQAALEEAGAITREFAFPLPTPVVVPGCKATAAEPGTIRLTLRDDALPPSVHDGSAAVDKSADAAAAVGVQTWGAAVLVCDILTRQPGLFHAQLQLGQSSRLDVLELGAGTGLVGMATARYLEQAGRSARVILTDYHRQVLDNLRSNIAQNFSDQHGILPVAERLDWQELHQGSTEVSHRQTKRPQYDLILLADVIYAPEHATWIHSCVHALLKKPTTRDDNQARAHLVMAVRASGKFQGLYKTVEAAFDQTRSELRIESKRWLEKRAGIGRDDEAGYLWYELAWSAYK